MTDLPPVGQASRHLSQRIASSGRVIGLTGGIGSGKSTIAAWLAVQGVLVFDADRAVQDILRRPEAVDWAARHWGEAYLEQDGVGRRLIVPQIAALIFSDAIARRDWEGYVHPLVQQVLESWLASAEPTRIKVLEIPLLFEVGWDKIFDEVWVVYAPATVRVQRVQKRSGLKMEEIEARLRTQMPLEEKAVRADLVIDNSGTWEETVSRLEEIKDILRI